MRILLVESEPTKFMIQYQDAGLLLWAVVLKEDLWNNYIVRKKLHIVAEGEQYEMNEFFNDCDMIAQELAKKCLLRKMSLRSQKLQRSTKATN